MRFHHSTRSISVLSALLVMPLTAKARITDMCNAEKFHVSTLVK